MNSHTNIVFLIYYGKITKNDSLYSSGFLAKEDYTQSYNSDISSTSDYIYLVLVSNCNIWRFCFLGFNRIRGKKARKKKKCEESVHLM